MKTVAIIAEFNPFHNGHKYLIDEAKKRTAADNVIIIMSGDWTQSGKPAICTKETRTKMCLENGADLVIMLPTVISTASAEIFATGAVSILNSLGVVDYLCFGSEDCDVLLMERIADLLNNEPEDFKIFLNENLKKGISFPAARANALLSCVSDGEALSELLSKSNYILGIEYIRAIRRLNSKIIPVPIKREAVSHSDRDLSDDLNYASASAIRHAILSYNLENTKRFMPYNAYMELSNTHCFNPDLLMSVLVNNLFNMPNNSLCQYSDAAPELVAHIKNNLVNAPISHYDRFVQEIQPKNLTYSRVSRFLSHVLLGIKAETMQNLKNADYILYARILGFKKSSSSLLKDIKNNSAIPLISKTSDGINTIINFYADFTYCVDVLESFKADLYAGNLYRLNLRQDSGCAFRYEEQNEIIVL